MLIKIHPDLRRHTSNLEELTTTGSSVGENLENLFNTYPQLLTFLTVNKSQEADKTTMQLNGEYLFDPADNYRTVTDSDVLEIGRDVPEGAGGVAKIIAGVVLIAIGVVLNFTPAFAASPYFYAMGASLIVGGAAELIIGPPKLPTFDSGNSTSATYTFSGIKNTTVSGTPIPIVYGRHRVGGHILNCYVDVRDQYNYLYIQTGTPQAPTTKEATAYHEAGHAVVAVLVGAFVEEVFLSEIPQPASQVLGEDRASDEVVNGGTRLSDTAQVDAFGRGLLAFAGISAQFRLLDQRGLSIDAYQQDLTIGAQHDFDAFDVMLSTVPPAIAAQAKRDINRTLYSWFTDPTTWSAVELVAAALLERGRVTGPELVKLVRG